MYRLIQLTILICITLLLQAGCGSRNLPVAPEQTGQVEPPTSVVLPPLSELGESPSQRAVSASVPMDLSLGNFTPNAVEGGGTVQLPSSATEMSAGWWGMSVTYDTKIVPYLAPYEATITATGGDYWFALADYETGHWNILPVPYSGTQTFPIGLDANAANVNGSCWFAVITFGGEDVTISSIDLDYPDAPAPDQPVNYQVEMEMDDGTILATDVLLPFESTGMFDPAPPWPVILMRTPYDKANVLTTELEVPLLGTMTIAEALSTAKIVFVFQYFRGRLDNTGLWPDSSGTETLFREHAGPDFNDALETVEWIEGCHFYNDTLMLSGPSALGLWIYQAATQLGDRVDGIYPQVSCGDVGDWAAARNGCFKRSNVEGWLTGNGFPPALITEAETNFGSDTYWDAVDFDTQASGTNCPGYHEAGWWDVDIEATIHSWNEINTNGGANAVGNQWLIIGPGGHDSMRSSGCGDLAYPQTSDIHDPRTIPDRWDGLLWTFDVLGRNIGFNTPTNNVYAYWVGEEGNSSSPHNTWYELASWPPSYADQTYYLGAGSPHGGMTDVVPAEGTDNWKLDPTSPCTTAGGANLPGGPMLAGPTDQTLVETHDDVLMYYSIPLSADVSIGGPIRVVLHVETDAADTDIMVKLIDDYGPGGGRLNVADSAVRLSYYLEQQGLGPVVPGTVYEVELEVGQRGYVFTEGHMICVDIQSTNYPRFDINPGNGDNFFTGINGVTQNNVIHFGPDNQTRLILPIFDPSV